MSHPPRKVYVVTCDYSYETRTIYGVYASESMAKAAATSKHQCNADDHSVEGWEVTEPPESVNPDVKT